MTTPAGWYDDGSGRQRWWDGEQWTEHFAPEADAAQTDATPADATPTDAAVDDSAAEVPSYESSLDDTVVRPTETIIAPEATHTAPDAGTAPDGGAATDHAAPAASFDAPAASSNAPAGTAPAADDHAAYVAPAAAPPAYSAPGAPSYPGAAAPAYNAPDVPAYVNAPGYPAAPGNAAPGGYAPGGPGYPAPYGTPSDGAPKKLSVLGLVGLGLSVLGTILVFIPVIQIFGFVVLGAGLIVSIVSLFLKGKKWPGIAGIILAVVGTILGVVMIFVYLFSFAAGVSSEIDRPSSSSSSAPSESSGPDDSSASGDRPTSPEVAVGLEAIFAASGSDGYTETQILCFADAFVASDLDDETLRKIAESDGLPTDQDAAYGFAEVLSDTDTVTACFTG